MTGPRSPFLTGLVLLSGAVASRIPRDPLRHSLFHTNVSALCPFFFLNLDSREIRVRRASVGEELKGFFRLLQDPVEIFRAFGGTRKQRIEFESQRLSNVEVTTESMGQYDRTSCTQKVLP